MNSFETRAEATGNVSGVHSEKRLCLLGQDAALDVCYTLLDYTPFGDEGDRVEGSVAQLDRLDAWIAAVGTCLTERERRGGYRQKMYADTYSFYWTAAIRQIVRRFSSFLKVW